MAMRVFMLNASPIQIALPGFEPGPAESESAALPVALESQYQCAGRDLNPQLPEGDGFTDRLLANLHTDTTLCANRSLLKADGEGVEPPRPLNSTVFKTAAVANLLDHPFMAFIKAEGGGLEPLA